MSGTISAADLGLDLRKGGEKDLFGWFLASYLFGKRISQEIAAETWKKIFRSHGRDTPRKIANCTHEQLVKMLQEGHYNRYDESTANYLKETCQTLTAECGGTLTKLSEQCGDRKAFEAKLSELKGVGPKTLEIFMREARPVLYG